MWPCFCRVVDDDGVGVDSGFVLLTCPEDGVKVEHHCPWAQVPDSSLLHDGCSVCVDAKVEAKDVPEYPENNKSFLV